MPELKILLGGIPLGCDNIGDEAILGCVVGILRRAAPGASVTVCTAERKETAALLGIETAPLYGFKREHSLSAFGRFVRNFDWYIWCGATGLSDYPAVAIGLLETARKQKVSTIVWGVGMDSEPNPVFFRVGGRKRALFHAAELLTLGRVPLTVRYETWLWARMRQRIVAELNHCRFVMVRDPQTAEGLRKCGFDTAIVGADSAILQRTGRIPPVKPGHVRIGFCVSAQRSITKRDDLVALWNLLTEQEAVELVLIPMNPETDFELMGGLAARMAHPERAHLVNVLRPNEVQGVAASCDVVVSSRLHLLILSANVGTPIIGIERGSKIRNFLAAFGLAPAGTVYQCDFNAIVEGINGFLADSGEAFRAVAKQVRGEMLARLDAAEKQLEELLKEPNPKKKRN